MEKYIFDESNWLLYELQNGYYIFWLVASDNNNYSIPL